MQKNKNHNFSKTQWRNNTTTIKNQTIITPNFTNIKVKPDMHKNNQFHVYTAIKLESNTELSQA